MKTTYRLLMIGLISVGLVRISRSQSYTATVVYVDADIINATTIVDPLAEKIKDVPASNFSLFINNPGLDTIWVNMQLQGYVTLDEDHVKKSFFDENPYTKKPFPVPPGGRLFRSIDATNSPDIDFAFRVDETVKKELKDKVANSASGGLVPSGTYEAIVAMQAGKYISGRWTNLGDITITPTSDITIRVTNPTTATLILPDQSGYVYPSPFPQFQWSYDVRSVTISVYEKRPEQLSLEDAISSSSPYLVVNIDRQKSGNLSIFTYPQTNAGGPGVNILEGPRPLERGKMYVVVLDGNRTAFGTQVEPLRTIRSFTISDPDGELVKNMLQTIFSGGPFQNVVNAIQDQKLAPNTSRMSLNGIPLSSQELQMLLNQNKNKIKSVHFEE
ncbi:MAG: hypothetical protein KGJ59_06870 [Bacteroidota bacterium]|nr:hypothetical protein [Bacteroidota bacterium]